MKSRPPDNLRHLFDDQDRFAAFKGLWRQWAERGDVKLLDVAATLRLARDHARGEQEYQRALSDMMLSRADFLAQRNVIRGLLRRVFQEIEKILHAHDISVGGKLDRLCLLRDRQLGYMEQWGAPEGDEVLFFQPLAETLWPELETLAHSSDTLMTRLDHVGSVFQRKRGHQKQPWLAFALRNLRAAGLRKAEADELLRLANLKGADSADEAR
jgi:hypothetical protein